MCLPTTEEGMHGAIAWYCASRIVGRFDADFAEGLARKAVDPNYKGDMFADKPKAKLVSAAESLTTLVARVHAKQPAGCKPKGQNEKLFQMP